MPGLGRAGLLRLIKRFKTLQKQLTTPRRGCEIDRIYFRVDAWFIRQVIVNGALLSEAPPGSKPLPGHFHGRNRIISGLGLDTLVIEACRDSGALLMSTEAGEIIPVLYISGGHRSCHAVCKTGGVDPSEPAERVLGILGLTPCHSNELTLESGLTACELSVIFCT